jgi:hypothetical protein
MNKLIPTLSQISGAVITLCVCVVTQGCAVGPMEVTSGPGGTATGDSMSTNPPTSDADCHAMPKLECDACCMELYGVTGDSDCDAKAACKKCLDACP